MDNTEKLLRAFIEASDYDIETTESIKRTYLASDIMDNGEPKENALPASIIKTTDYKVTKRPKTKEEVVKDMCKELFEFAKEADTKLVSFISPGIKVTLNKESGELEVEDNENI